MSVAVSLLRHATVVVDVGGQRVLVDPMLDAAGTRGPVVNTPAPRDNPLVDLPAGWQQQLDGIAATVVTHLHADHLDDAGTAFLRDAGQPIFGQAEDLGTLREQGLDSVGEIGGRLGEVELHRTGGRHGHDELADMLGPVSGVVFDHGADRIYVAGDTVRCDEFDAALAQHRPTVVVLNAGGARFLEGAPITMTADEVIAIAGDHPGTVVIAIHMDAINHCADTREVLRGKIASTGVTNIVVPADGETWSA